MASNNLMEVELPSKGLAYEGEIPSKVTIKSLTVKEEKMIFGSTQANGPERALRACIVDPEKINLSKMLPQDEHFLLIKLRIHTFGPEYNVTTRCPECDKKIDLPINLDELTINELPDDFKELIELKLPNGDVLGLKLLRNEDNEAISELASKRAKLSKEDEGEIEYVLRIARMIKSINGEDKNINDAQSYVENLSSNDSAYIESILEDEYKFGYDTVVTTKCPKCGEEIQFSLPLSSEFFRPKFKRIR